MFNKREQSDARPPAPESRKAESSQKQAPNAHAASSRTAVIGPSIQIDGTLRGDEDLVIEGRVKGAVELKQHSVTIGQQGDVQADIHAHTIFVDGNMDGHLIASERVVIRQSARIKGTIVSPRVSLEDGARFNGSIDMDPDSEALDKVFAAGKSASRHGAAAPDKPAAKPNGQPAGGNPKASDNAAPKA
ncbi:polymer-forming cytoskeletal protein [Wenzhouxiangella sp. AB-CW3]|uniref:bactofilin family protein n=1 Tax=Wenzhouxiangella sp. AB-CW3 TaxID=2771012 RepID=UPI00168BA2C0|nr:polymer-forming cytoskeletal protein [Wenzhouxiangella sp. AB-CW3]QOC22856.1 polymer-forming cytoskeletal protein [Wenzhouxiangella sp. AB-CW3]